MSDIPKDEAEKFTAAVKAIPGLRGRDIPEILYDHIRSVGDGITVPVWGRPVTPQQMQHLHDNGIHDPAAIHAEFAQQQHPYAPDLTLGEYQQHASALKTFKQHGGSM